ncbi:MAG TPA: tetratricopeptide repeat protein, partial [Burkholderiales bacterium]|nr:tetratricopeptide repeat protein [Burkholderiales bacterium]
LYYSMNDYNRSEPLLWQVLAIRQKNLPPNHSEVAESFANLAELYRIKRDYARAEPLFEQALAIDRKALPHAHPDVAAILNNQAALYRDKGDYAQAERIFQQSLSILEKTLLPDHPNIEKLLANLAESYWFKGDLSETVRILTRSADVGESNIVRVLAAGSETQKRLYLERLLYNTHAIMSLHLRAAPDNPDAARLALTTLLRRKGRALDAMTNQIEALRRHSVDAQVLSLLDELTTARTQLAKLVLNSPGSIDPQEYRRQTALLQARVERLEAEASDRSAVYRAQTQPITLRRVQQAIPANAALVELAVYIPADPKTKQWGSPRYVAYVLKRKGEPGFIDLGEAVHIDQAITLFSGAFAHPARGDVKSAGRALDKLIMQPIRKLLGRTTTILLAPDGKLHTVPFNALLDEEGRYLIERYAITYLTSGRDLLRLETSIQSRQPPLVLAGPAFDLEDKKAGEPASPANDASRGATINRYLPKLAAVARRTRRGGAREGNSERFAGAHWCASN